jgi:hypothetical protein
VGNDNNSNDNNEFKVLGYLIRRQKTPVSIGIAFCGCYRCFIYDFAAHGVRKSAHFRKGAILVTNKPTGLRQWRSK